MEVLEWDSKWPASVALLETEGGPRVMESLAPEQRLGPLGGAGRAFLLVFSEIGAGLA